MIVLQPEPVLKATVILTLVAYCSAACGKPKYKSNVFSFAGEKSSFGTGEVLELICTPGYEPENVHRLICQQSSEWKGTVPDCEKIETTFRWWILFIVLVIVLVGVPVGVPKLYYHFRDERHVQRLKLIHQGTGDYLDTMDAAAGRNSTNDLSELVGKERSYGHLHSEMENPTLQFHDIVPQPLPPKREFTSAGNKAYVA